MGGFVDDAISVATLGTVDTDFAGDEAARAARNASEAQVAAGQDAIGFQRESRDLARSDLQTFRQLGTNNIEQFSNLLTSQGQSDFLNNNAIVQDSIADSTRSTNNLFASRGKLDSGGRELELFRRGAGIRSGAVNDQFNRLLQSVNIGQASAAGQANIAQNTGNSIADLQTQIGNSQAAGFVGQANARQQGFNNLLSLGNIGAQFLGPGA